VVKDDSGKRKQGKKKYSQQSVKTEIHQYFDSTTAVNTSY